MRKEALGILAILGLMAIIAESVLFVARFLSGK